MLKTAIELKDTWLAYGGNVQFRIEEGMDQSLRLFARPYLEDVRTVLFLRERWVTGTPDWHDDRWARFLRWLDRKIKLPEPLRILIGMNWWRCSYSEEKWPEESLDKIRIQMAYLNSLNQEPNAICCGPMGKMSLEAEAYANPGLTRLSSWDGAVISKLFGLPIRVIPWLAPDEVMVV